MTRNHITSITGIYSGVLRYVGLRRRGFNPGVDRPVIVCHGGGGEWEQGVPPTFTMYDETLREIAHNGYTLMMPELGTHTWGNDLSVVTRLPAAITHLQSTGQAASGKVGLIGGSMGNVTACNYAKRNLANVAAMIGVIPACSVAYHYSHGDDATGGFQPEIDAAYSGNYSTNGPPAQRDPTLFATDLAGIRYGLFYNSDDPAIPTNTVTGLHTAINSAACTVTNLGVGGHSTDTITPTQILDVLEDGNWT